MLFPEYRPRRLRQNSALRRIIRETVVSTDDLILPLFTVSGKNIKNPIQIKNTQNGAFFFSYQRNCN